MRRLRIRSALVAGWSTLALVAACVAVARASHVGTAFLALLVCAFAVYLVGLYLLRRGGRFGPVFGLACAIQSIPLAAPALSADADVYRRAAAALLVLVATWLVSRHRASAAALVGWNPVVAVHFAGGGHRDALMMALVAAALALGDRGSARPAGVAWGLAVVVKWVAVLLLPLRGLEARARGRRVDHLGFAVTVLVALAVAAVLWRFHWLHVYASPFHGATRRTAYALPSRLGLPTWVFVAAYAAAYAALLAGAARGTARLGLALGLLLLCLPSLLVWYVLWPLVASAYDRDRAATLLSLALCAYLLPQTLT